MKIALLGYGKMGKEIEKVALNMGHEIVFRKTSKNSFLDLNLADVAIDFSHPRVAGCNISECLTANIPVVSGTTGWLSEYENICSLCKEKKGTFIYASNFSLGMNIFFKLNNYLAKIMSKFNQYSIYIEETHHTEKIDTPSGTAISLANQIVANSKYKNWTSKNALENQIKINSKRIENVSGIHSVFYNSDIDAIEIKHTAYNRAGFAIGALLAAEWILGKEGIFTMDDVLDFKF